MRIYLLTLTPLSHVSTLSIPPQEGDIICYIRQAQDPNGKSSALLEQQNIQTYFIDALFTSESVAEIDSLGTQFLRTWFIDDTGDYSTVGPISLGTSYAMEIAHTVSPRLLIKLGEGLRKTVEHHPQATHIYSDARNGQALFKTKPEYFPVADVVRHVSESLGKRAVFMEPASALPFAFELGGRNHFSKIIKSFFGQFRPSWIKARQAFSRNQKLSPSKPVIYFFVGRAQELIARELAKRNLLRVVSNQNDIPGVDAFRCEHIFALPGHQDITQVFRLLRTIRCYRDKAAGDARFVLNDMVYDKLLYEAVYRLMKIQVWAFLIVVAQSKKFQKRFSTSALVINDALNEPMGNLVSLSQHLNCPIYLIPHGMNLMRNAGFSAAQDRPRITYLAYGHDHLEFFSVSSESAKSARRFAPGNPLTVSLANLGENRPKAHKKRLLLLALGHTDSLASGRVFSTDIYYIEIFKMVPQLIEEGWEVTIRPHPYHGYALEQRIADSFEIADQLKWDTSPSLENTLPHHDIVVCNFTSAFYQSMYAGWPTIFYTPAHGDNDDTLMAGLPAASDLDRPVTNDPVVLGRMIRDSLDPDSMVSTFPARFAGELAPRFIGPDPAHADQLIADFIEGDYLGKT